MTDAMEIDVWQGDIAELEVDAIVIPANETLFMTAPVARGVKLKAGETVEREAVEQGPIAAGSAVVTGGGALPARHVIHAVGVGHDLRADADRLAAALNAAFEIAARMGFRRLAVALIGAERGVFAPEPASATLAAVIHDRVAAGRWLPDSIVAVGTTAGELTAQRLLLDAVRPSLS
jgi:O-acetyl-ADP-ribose deacetylase (regulator of RNase III)